MLKKIVSVIILFLLLSGNIFAYSPTKSDQNYIDKVTTKIYYAYKKDSKKIDTLVDKIHVFQKKYPNTSERNKFILNSILYYIHQLKIIMKPDNIKVDESLSGLLDSIDDLKKDDSFSKLFPEYNTIMKEKFVYDDSNDNSTNSNNNNNNNSDNWINYTYNYTTSNCNKSLWTIVSNYSKTSVTVSTLSWLESALNTANSRSDTSKRYEIIIKNGTYNLTNWLSIKWNKIIVRWEDWDAKDVVLKWKWMKSSVTHWFWVTWNDAIIWDLSIGEVKNHAIQVHGEKDSDNLLVHNVEIYNTWEQMLKWSFDTKDTSKWSDNWVIECSKFYYTSNYWPQYYIGWIDVHNWKNWIVRNNSFRNIRSPESNLAEHAIHFWSNSENTLVENNIIVNCDRWIWFGLWDKWHKYWVIRNNFIYHDSTRWDVWIWLENSEGTKVYNNTIYQKHNYGNAIEYRFSNSKNIEIINNLTNKNIASRDNWSATISNNITNVDSSFFNNIDNLDFSLKSIAKNIIDLWKNLDLVKYDLFWNTRDSKTDIWAYEYGYINSWSNTNNNTLNNLSPSNWNQINFKNTYEVGPNKQYAELQDVPWESLQKSSIVKIYWRENPYYSKFVVNVAWTKDEPVVITWIPNNYWELPIISWNNAVTSRKLDYWNEERSIIKIWGSSIPVNLTPSYIYVENLDIKNANPNYRYTDDKWNIATYTNNAAWVHIEYGDHITIKNCKIHDNWNGIFSTHFSSNIIIAWNYIYDNWIVWSIYEHNTYTESTGITYEYNKFWKLKSWAGWNNLKDRSSNTVIRYNHIEWWNRQLDLVDSDYQELINSYNYGKTYVYWNTLIEPFDDNWNSQFIHYGWDSSTESHYRNWTLYLYNNTFVSYRNANPTLVRMSLNSAKAEIINNVFVVKDGYSLAITAWAGQINLSNNYLPETWKYTFESNFDWNISLSSNISWTNAWFLDLNNGNFHLNQNSALRNKALNLTSNSNFQEVEYEYKEPQSIIQRNTINDIWAFEWDKN